MEPRGSQETLAGASELRSRIEAAEAGESEVYEAFIEDRGQYAEQADEVESQIDSLAFDDEEMDLSPPGSDRYEELAKTVFESDRWRFEELAEEYSGIGFDAFEDKVSLQDSNAKIYSDYVDDSLEGWADRPDRDELPTGEVSIADTRPIDTAAVVEIDDVTITSVWEDLMASHALQRALARALGNLFGGLDLEECYDELKTRNVPFWLRKPIADATKGYTHDIWIVVSNFVPELADPSLSAIEDLLAVASLFNGLEHPETVTIVVRDAFVDPTQTRRDQRVDVCDLLAVLAASLDIQIVGDKSTLQTLADRHRLDLPGVSEWCNRHRGDNHVGDLSERALAALDPDGRAAMILRDLADSPDGVLSRHALESTHAVSSQRISQVLRTDDNSLIDLGLIEIYGPDGDQMIQLLEAGERVIDTFNREHGRQQSLSDFDFSTGKSHLQCRVTPREGVGGEEDVDLPQEGRPYRTRYANSNTHAAAAACGRSGAVTIVDGSIEGRNGDDGKVRLVSYDDDRDEAVVAVRAAEPLPCTVSVALALASPRFIDRALPTNRLGTIDDPPAILRDARNIGALSSDALADPEVLRDDLVEWGESIAQMTTKLRHQDYEDRCAFRSRIMRLAHGLTGSIVHLLDLVGTDIIREIRVPQGANLEKHLKPLAKSIGISAAIQSRYGAFAPYRQLFDVPNCDSPLLSPTVDAADPTGTLIGSFVIRGPDVHRFRDVLEYYLETPRELVDDAPEFGIDITVRDVDRTDFEQTITRILEQKNIATTHQAISVLYGLVATPHDVARVLNTRLSPEDRRREIRPDELRVALRGLEPTALVPELPRSVGKIIAALLTASEPLSQKTVAERADVSTRTVRNHADKLAAFDIVRIGADGYRLALSFVSASERRQPVFPSTTSKSASLLFDAVDPLLVSTLPPAQYGDPADPIGSVLFEPQDPLALLEIDAYAPWIKLAGRLTDCERQTQPEKHIHMGPELAQQPIEAAAMSAAD
ncbi:helix-turn-helix domain-containing protein [Natronorubrum thiooxidans]|uniref:HTH domain-containing protein n=1 Tax=Natronorubrum thiooxidans TaxID=308853 RepID=UPI001F2D0D01|nr:HTH domain-containing protein [Natronorubrum thiooxidans]